MRIYNFQSCRAVTFNIDKVTRAEYGANHESIKIWVGGDRPLTLNFNLELHGDEQFKKLEARLFKMGLLT